MKSISNSRGEVSDQYRELFSRNLGFITEAEQEKLRRSTVAIAGMGGVGGLLAERLVRLGIGQLKIIDPEDFERSNFNRQFYSSITSLGRNKAEVISEYLRNINPQADIHYGKNGIKTQEDADRFVHNCNVVVDEMDFGLFKESVFLQRAARKGGLFYMFASAVGFGALIAIFNPDGLTMEEYNNLDSNIDFNGTDEPNVPQEIICPVIPSYAGSIPLDIVKEIISGARPAPTNSIGVGLTSILTANEVMNVLLKKRDVASAPQYTYIDLMDRKFIVGTIRQQ